MDEASGQARADDVVRRLDVERGAVGRGDASRHEAGLQVVGELGVPAEVAQVVLRQRRFSFEM